METSMEHKNATQQVTRKKGGCRTMPFIIANETFDKVANVGLHINMILYLLYEYHFDPPTAAIIIFLWNAMSNFMPIFGAFLSDSCLGRFRVIAMGTLIELLGLVVLWLTAIIRRARPPDCDASQPCAAPTAAQLLFLFSSFVLLAVGAGGIRPCSIAFAADQINNPARFLNKACIIKDREKDLNLEGMAVDPWSLCTVRQVEELKAIIKVIPMWSTGIIFATTITQHSFSVVQAGTMDRHVFNHELPATSFSVFAVLSMILWVTLYDRVLVPLFSGRALTVKQRLGIGLVLSCLATAVSAMVERKRRNAAIREGLIDNPNGVVEMSAMWLVPQYCLTGLAETFNIIAQIEFFYTQFPKNMSSIAIAIYSLGFGIGNVLGSIIVKAVKVGTVRRGSGGGEGSWLSTNVNRGRYDYYYGLLCVLSCVNVLYFLACSWGYGSTQDIHIWDEKEAPNEDQNNQ